jgi:hypothetical protein
MYNLLISFDSEAWNGDPYILEVDRCIEYTDEKITEKYSDLSPAQIDEIIQIPCIFAYEKQCHKDPKFGFIHKIVKRQGQGLVKIHYEIIHLDKFLTQSDLEEMHIELDIHVWEYNRTHWAIKDVNLTEELNAKGINLLPYINRNSYEYGVAISFAGEDREYAQALAEALKSRGLKVFYDHYEKSTLWGKNLYTYLSNIYQNKARYCVIFLSKHYAAKVWTNHEREAAQARALNENKEYILPIRLDDTDIPGIPPTVSYLSWPPETAETIADAIMDKIGRP